MALRIWLPLNGDLKNIGCSRNISITSNGATVDNNGKIGKCYSFGSNKYLKINDYATEFLTYNEFSLSVWFKCTAQNTAHGGSALISGGNWNQAANLLNLALGNFSSDHYSRLLVSGSGGWANGYSYNFYLNQWYHVVLTSGNGAVRAYVNGELIGDTYAAFKPASLEQTWICIGNGTYTQVFHFNGLMNDVRIYDHCLSALEVKEISQGLVLHYKLNGFNGGAGENLISNSEIHTITANASNQYNYFWAVPTGTLTIGETYTFSAIAKITGTNAPTKCTVYNYHTNPNTGGPRSDNFIADGVTRDSFTFVANATGFICYAGNSGSTGGFGAEYKQLKLEKGSAATPWTPSSIEMGKDLTKVVDSSGYGNNGIAVNSPSNVADSKSRYNICTKFNGSNTYINAGTGAKVKDEITVAWWGYMDSWSSYTRAISCTEGGGWNFEVSSGKINFAMGTGTSSNTYKSCTSNTTLASLASGWHHFVGTYNGLESNLYIDGVLDKTLSCYTTKTPIYYHPSNSIIVGAEANAGNTAAGSYFNGKLSDIRIYATALSAEDILTLYNTPAHIDKLGGIHGFEFTEDQGNSINKNGQVKTGEIFENPFIKYDTNIYEESDGSTWVRIFHHNDPTTSGYFTKNADWEHGVYINENKWYNVEQIPYMPTYEFMVKQKTTSTATEQKYRWTQNINPNNAVWADVKPGTVTYNTSSGYTSSTMGGLWRMNGSARMCIANASSGNWYGALGSWTAYQTNQVPGFPNSNISTGYIDLYIRVYGLARIVKDSKIYANNFIEK